MIFTLGKTFEQRSKWHRVFCWFPQPVGEVFVWLETVERRAIFEDWEGTIFQYRLMNEVKA
jgi:hypothetical protein